MILCGVVLFLFIAQNVFTVICKKLDSNSPVGKRKKINHRLALRCTLLLDLLLSPQIHRNIIFGKN